MRPPCEIIVRKVLPAIRAELVRMMLEEGFSQQQIANRLDLSKAAVSQYVSTKRGKDITFSSDIKEKIRGLAKSLAGNLNDNDNEVVNSICSLCNSIQTSERPYSENLQKNCLHDCLKK